MPSADLLKLTIYELAPKIQSSQASPARSRRPQTAE